MPYRWNNADPYTSAQELTLWPHNSLPPEGLAIFVLITFGMITLPLYGVLGTSVFWGLLPFLMLAVFGVFYALRRNGRDRRILEVLTVTPEDMRLVRHNPRGPAQEWQCNTYWARVEMHRMGGPVPYYVTLSGAGREVEIGSFLSEDERKALYAELCDRRARLVRTT